MNLLDDYKIIEKGVTSNQSHRVYQLECKKTRKQLFVFSREHAGKTPYALAENAKKILYPINNVSTFADALQAVELYSKNAKNLVSWQE